MKFFLPAFIFLHLLSGCGSKNKLPPGILPKGKMEAVLWDLLEADQFLADFVLTKDTSVKKFPESIHLYEQVFHIHKTNKQQFIKSLTYYRTHPFLFKDVLDSLNVKKMPESKPPQTPLSDDSVATLPKVNMPLKKAVE